MIFTKHERISIWPIWRKKCHCGKSPRICIERQLNLTPQDTNITSIWQTCWGIQAPTSFVLLKQVEYYESWDLFFFFCRLNNRPAELNYRATLKCVPEYVNVRCINFCIWINLLTFTSVPIYCNGLCFIKIIEIKKKKKTKCMNRHFSNLRLKRYHHTKIRWRLFWQSLEAISFRKKERRFSKKKKNTGRKK